MSGSLKDDRELLVADISELVILSVLAALGTASLPSLFESLKVATENAKAPFAVGPSLEEVLKWRERLNEVKEEQRGTLTFYRITDQGLNTVHHYDTFLQRAFPNIGKISEAGTSPTA